MKGKIMKRLLITAVTVLAVSSAAMAQEGRAQAVGSGVAKSSSQSGAAAVSGSVLIQNAPANTTSSNTIRNSGSLRTAPSAPSIGLGAAGIESCNSTAGVSGSWMGGSIGIAGPVQDTGCDLRLFSRTMWSYGMKDAAVQILCNDARAAEALAASGVVCRVGPTAQKVSAPQEQVGIWLKEGKTGKDRLCLNYDAPGKKCRQWAN